MKRNCFTIGRGRRQGDFVDDMTIKIDKIVYPGRSLSRGHGKVILTDNGLPQECVKVKILKDRKNYIEARTIEVLESSRYRAEARCRHYRVCSQYQYIGYPFQLELKKRQVAEMFSHNLKADLSEYPVISQPQVWNYRNKAHMHIIWNSSGPSLAYHLQKQYREYQEIDKCFLLSENINLFLDSLLEQIKAGKWHAVKEIAVRENYKKEILLSMYVSDTKKTSVLKNISDALSSRFSVAGSALFYKGKIISVSGRDCFLERAGGIDYYTGFSSFFQVNRAALNSMIKDLASSVPFPGSGVMADIYCGVGIFGLAFAGKVKRVIGVEAGRDNVEFLRKNIERNKVGNFSVEKGTSRGLIRKVLKNGIDILILDPPRSGLGDYVCGEITKTPAGSIIYISCDPATLVRDLQALSAVYNIEKVSIYDFFPHTPHIETCTILSLR